MLLPSSLQLPEVFRPSLGDLLPTLASKLDGGGIFLFWQNSEDVALAPDGIMHDDRSLSWDQATCAQTILLNRISVAYPFLDQVVVEKPDHRHPQLQRGVRQRVKRINSL